MSRESLARIAVIAAPLALYEAAARMGLLSPLDFVPLTTMLAAMFGLVTDPAFVLANFLPTAAEIVASVCLGSLLGLAAGVLLWRSPAAYEGLSPYFTMFYAIPVIGIYPVFVSMFGISPISPVAIGALYSAVTVALNTAVGLRSVAPVYAKVAQSLRLSFRQTLLHVLAPAAWPQIFTGLRLAVSFSTIGVIGTEFILAAAGLGHAVAISYNNFDPKTMYGGILLIVVIAVAINGSLGGVEARLYREQAAE